MTHKTPHKIYVAIDEEITTVVEQLRHAPTEAVILLVPQHAVLFQSVVNLKLLEQEAGKLHKNIAIMTKDVDGATCAQKAGIHTIPYVAQEDTPTEQPSQPPQPAPQKRIHVQSPPPKRPQPRQPQPVHTPVQSHIINPTQQQPRPQHVAGVHAAPQHRQNIPPQPPHHAEAPKQETLDQYEQSLEEMRVQSTQPQNMYQPPQRALGITQFPVYNGPQNATKKQRFGKKALQKNFDHSVETEDVSRGIHFAIKGFLFAGVFLIGIIFLIILLPKTSLTVTPKTVHVSEDVEMTAHADHSTYDTDRRMISARMIERDITYTKEFSATGNADVGPQKAQGKLTIYNEFSAAPQPLVATTRFLSQDGVLFRLAKHVTVPGMKDGTPGKIEVLVVADKTGAQSNIGPTRFTIPGFGKGKKAEKIYGVSETNMTGGGDGGKGVAVVTQQDIDRAKSTMNTEVDAYVAEQLRAVVREDREVILPRAIHTEVTNDRASVVKDTMADTFLYEVTTHVKAIVFAKDDALAVVRSSVHDQYPQYDVEQLDIHLDYTIREQDFDDHQMKLVTHAKANIVPAVDVDTLKKNIAGKKHDALEEMIVTDYGESIARVTFDRIFPGYPPFIAQRISRFGFMTDITVADVGDVR